MLSSFGISRSGILASVDALSVSANNLANINTDGFKKDVVRLKEGENGGVVVRIEGGATPPSTFVADGGRRIERSNVDLVEEVVNQMFADHLFVANKIAFKTASEMQENLLDIVA